MLEKIKTFYRKHRELIIYLLIGGLTTLVSFAVCLPLMWWAKWPASVSNAVAWVVAVLFAYVTNKLFVFESKDWSFRVAFPEFLKFVGCRVASGVFETAFLALTIDLPQMGEVKWYSIFMKVLASIIVVILNYIGSKLFVFRKK